MILTRVGSSGSPTISAPAGPQQGAASRPSGRESDLRKVIDVWLHAFMAVAMLSALPSWAAAQADLTEQQRSERCENNRHQLDVLEGQLLLIPDLTNVEERIARMRTVVGMIKRYRDTPLDLMQMANVDQFIANLDKYDLSDQFRNCLYDLWTFGEGTNGEWLRSCLSEMESAIERKIDATIELQSSRSDIERRRADVRRQIADHKTNLAALRCDTAVGSKGCSGFAGRWDSGGNGLVTLSASGSGTYLWRDRTNTITGSVSGNVLDGTWSQLWHPEPRFRNGKVRFKLAPDGNSWTGEWWDANGARAGHWNGTCVGGS